MTPKDALHGKTTRLRADHIVLSQLFEDSRAHLPRILRRHDDGERERRKHDASRRDVAARNREEVQLQSEDIEQHESDPKARHRDAEERQHTDHIVNPAVAVKGCDDAQWQGDQDRHGSRSYGERQRARQALHELVEHGYLRRI